MIEAIGKDNNPLAIAVELLQSEKGYEKNIGAELIVLISSVKLDEESVDAKALDSFDFAIPDNLITVLHDLAIGTKTFVFVRAVTELTISQIVDIGAMTPFLDRQLLDLASYRFQLCCLYRDGKRLQSFPGSSVQIHYNRSRYLFSLRAGKNP